MNDDLKKLLSKHKYGIPFKKSRRNDEEYHLQCQVVQWLGMQHPDCLFTISPSGMKLPIQVAGKLKKMGYKSGTPDLNILEARLGFHGLHVELKTLKGSPSLEQVRFCQELNARGYLATIAYGFEEAVAVIALYLRGVW